MNKKRMVNKQTAGAIGALILIVGIITTIAGFVYTFIMLNAMQTEVDTAPPSTYSGLYTFLHGLYEAQTTGMIGVIIGMIMIGVGGAMMKSLSSEPVAAKNTIQQHKITAWLGRSKEQQELKKKEEKQQRPSTPKEIRSRLTDKDKRIMRAGKIIAIIGLVLLVLSVILFFVFDIQTFLVIPSIVLTIGGVIIYLNGLGRHTGAVK